MVAVLTGCGSVGLEERKEIRSLFSKRQYSKALQILNNGKIKSDKKSQVLYFVEKGRLFYMKRDFTQAQEYFDKAKDLIDQYYTKSITQKLASSTLNDNMENYYGEIYEVSMLHYYLAQTYYQIYQTGEITKFVGKNNKDKQIKRKKVTLKKSKRRTYLFAARAEILAWDSYFKDVQRSGKVTLNKSDLIIKLFGATIHEAVGVRADLQIALQLYKDAKKVLYSVSNVLPTYNKKHKKYLEKRLDNISKLVTHKPKKNLDPTAHQKMLLNFIDGKILSLTKAVRPYDLKKTIKNQRISKAFAKKHKKKKGSNVAIVFEQGLIAPKKGKRILLGLKTAIDAVENPIAKALVATVGIVIIANFARNVLDLGRNRNMSYGQYSYTRNMVKIAATEMGFEFEIPMIEKAKFPKSSILEIFNAKGKLVKSRKFALIGPIGDMARQNLEEQVSDAMLKRGIRVGVKYLTAIALAYKTYKAKEGFIGSSLASAQFFISQKAILASEAADTRYWSTLPQTIRLADLFLKKGKYMAKVTQKSKVGKSIQKVTKKLGEFTVSNPKQMNIFSYYLP